MNNYFLRCAACVCMIAGLAACQSSAPRTTAAPQLELLGAVPLTLPADCSATGTFVVDFTVRPDGRTGKIEPAAAPSCVREALTAWVASFRYQPPGTETRTSVEWMLVEARQGT